MRRFVCLLVQLLAVLIIAGCGGDLPEVEPELIITTSPFEYPLELWDQGVEGETVLLVHVNSLGQVDSVKVHLSSGHAQFDSAALAGAYRLRFVPGRRGDKRVDMWARLPVKFSQETEGGTNPENRPR